MFLSMNWIGDFVDLSGLDRKALIHRFTLSTAEVEEVIHKGENITGVVAGKILTVEDVPKSRKLHMLTSVCRSFTYYTKQPIVSSRKRITQFTRILFRRIANVLSTVRLMRGFRMTKKHRRYHNSGNGGVYINN